jgi:hypothetical protein
MQQAKLASIDLILVYLLAFLAPISAFSLGVGSIRVEPERILLILCIASLFVHFCLNINPKRQRAVISLLTPIFIVVFYAVILTLLQADIISSLKSTYFNISEINDFIFRRGSKYIYYILMIVYFGLVLNKPEKTYRFIGFMCLSFCILEICGLLQSIVFLVAKVDLFPIMRGNLNDEVLRSESVTVPFAGLNFLRINSLATEPKVLGTLLGYAFFVKLNWRKFSQESKTYLPNSALHNWLDQYMPNTRWLSLLVILLTFSGSGLLSVMSGLWFHIGCHLDSRFNSSLGWKKIKILTLILLGVGIFISVSIGTGDALTGGVVGKVNDFLNVSIFRRLGVVGQDQETDFAGGADPEDGAFLYIVQNRPDFLVSGLGFGGFSNLVMNTDYLRVVYEDYLQSPFARNIFVETIFSVGLPGLLLLLIMFYQINLRYIVENRTARGKNALDVMSAQIIFMAFLIRGGTFLFLLLGLSVANHLNRRAQIISSGNSPSRLNGNST